MADAYALEALAAAQTDLAALAPSIRQRLAKRIDALADNPRPSGCKPISGRPGYLRIRVGDYRVVYGVNDAERVVTVVIIGHRRDVYQRIARRL
jgi:mRNA interferase RelE/StbE